MKCNESFALLGTPLPDSILREISLGNYDNAIHQLRTLLDDPDLPESRRQLFTLHMEMLHRLPWDYPLTKSEALKEVQRAIPDFTEGEFDALAAGGKIGFLLLHGEPRYFDRFLSSLCKSDPAFGRRADCFLAGMESAQGSDPALLRQDRYVQQITKTGSSVNRIRIRASLRLKDTYFVPGMLLRAHLPIPAACEQQSEIHIERMEPAGGILAPETALQRTVCWEERMEENHSFVVEYSYLHRAQYHDHPVSIEPPTPEDTEEQLPQIRFTPALLTLAKKLTEGISDPLTQARSFYDYITLNMHYRYMPAYFSQQDLVGDCIRTRSGDCGVFCLLFLTLCRSVGIPAQWQSGLAAEPGFCGAHDWVRFYIPSRGWLFADPSYGVAAVRRNREDLRNFYFGNLDPCRMVANRAFQAPFAPDKMCWRADPYDNQVGELETDGHGFAYHEYERSKEVLLCEEVFL